MRRWLAKQIKRMEWFWGTLLVIFLLPHFLELVHSNHATFSQT